MSITIELPFGVLVGDNRKMLKRGVLTKQYRAAKDNVAMLAMGQVRDRPVFAEGDVSVELLWWMPDRRRRDPSNYVKLLWDALEGVLWTNDGQIVTYSSMKIGYSKDDARVRLTATAGRLPVTTWPEAMRDEAA